MTNQQIFLDSLDGFGFEDLCAEIFRKLDYQVHNVQSTGDEGRDLILRSTRGDVTVVECKHWPNGSVGRPVVQKLHSAVVTFPAERGALVTTGKFTRGARAYANNLNVKIELIDRANLKTMAAKAGIDLLGNSDDVPILGARIDDYSTLLPAFDSAVFSRFISIPKDPKDLFSEVLHRVTRRPVYIVNYSLQQDFHTTVGLIHSIDVQSEVVFIRADTRVSLSSELGRFLISSKFEPESDIAGTLPSKAIPSETIGSFHMSIDSLHTAVKDQVSKIHRKTVSYSGRNNQSYTKECIPSVRKVFINDIKQIYLTEHLLDLQAGTKKYRFRFFENQDSLYFVEEPNVFLCQECNIHIIEGLICNDCGVVAHKPKFFRPHSFSCSLCLKTICKNCAFWARKLYIFKTILCHDCATTKRSVTPKKLRL